MCIETNGLTYPQIPLPANRVSLTSPVRTGVWSNCIFSSRARGIVPVTSPPLVPSADTQVTLGADPESPGSPPGARLHVLRLRQTPKIPGYWGHFQDISWHFRTLSNKIKDGANVGKLCNRNYSHEVSNPRCIFCFSLLAFSPVPVLYISLFKYSPHSRFLYTKSSCIKRWHRLIFLNIYVQFFQQASHPTNNKNGSVFYSADMDL